MFPLNLDKEVGNVIMIKKVRLGIILAISWAVITLPHIALGRDDPRVSQLEERIRNLETRMASVETALHKESQKQGMRGPMGRMPEPAPEMPPADAPAAGGMGGKGMGDKMDDTGGDM